MKNIYKLTIITFFLLLQVSCINADEDVLSADDLLKGKWQITSLKINNVIPMGISPCDYLRTMEFTDDDKVFFNEYAIDFQDETNCIYADGYSYNYNFTEVDIIKLTLPDGSIINTEILEISNEILKTKTVRDGSIVLEEYKKIN